ncbi:hypothetical protein QL285_020890 [Trifolium repens]|nr:hypothetical protein QL285_020890 [Trifolium repens]
MFLALSFAMPIMSGSAKTVGTSPGSPISSSESEQLKVPSLSVRLTPTSVFFLWFLLRILNVLSISGYYLYSGDNNLFIQVLPTCLDTS